ncbi:MAG: hypothetical protein PHX60_14855 [Giesbergeria sp.]|uniref:hypothetical protein n=1 Tax=Giesbergeria sp. TaxID=2818473 RepID=UPI00262D3488|nr:hypothetical protein [Giesbergeria sp.]MDD2610933.1 hypothetical protein [Giesbergeria sp.]
MAFFRKSGTVLLCGLVLGGAVQADEVVFVQQSLSMSSVVRTFFRFAVVMPTRLKPC